MDYLPGWSDDGGVRDLTYAGMPEVSWERAAELTFRLGGRWIVEPCLIGWQAWSSAAGPGEVLVWALTLRQLGQRLQDRAPLTRLPRLVSQLIAWVTRRRHRNASAHGSGQGSPARQLSTILVPSWDLVPAASLREAIALLPSPDHEHALALCDQVYPGLLNCGFDTTPARNGTVG